jgi:hypothetical protein
VHPKNVYAKNCPRKIFHDSIIVLTSENREGSPLLTVETEVNGDFKVKTTNERGPSLFGSLGLSCRYKRFASCLGRPIVGPVQNIFFLALHSSSSFVPIAQKAGQAVVLGRLSLNMCLWYTYQERNIGFLIHV